MVFTPKTNWQDSPSRMTPIASADLIRIEQGVAVAHTTADTATTALLTKATYIMVVTGDEQPQGDFTIFVGGSVRPTYARSTDFWTGDLVSISPDTEPPSVPGGLVASAITSSGFTVSWTGSTGGPSAYEVSINGVTYGQTSMTTMSVTGRSQSTTYLVTVRARDAAGNWSAASPSITVLTAPGGGGANPPSVPIGLLAKNVTPTGFDVLWTASTGTPSGYEVYLNGVAVGTPATNTYSAAGLSSGIEYAVSVRARNAAGDWSAQSSALTARTAIATGVRASSAAKVGYLGSPGALAVINVGDATPGSWGAAWVAGTLLVGGNDVTIDHYRINSDVAFTGNNPTITNSEVIVRPQSTIGIKRDGGTGVMIVSDVTVVGQPNGTAPQQNGIWGDTAGMLARRCDVSGTGDGIHLNAMAVASDATVTQCYVHDQSYVDEAQHCDGIQVYSSLTVESSFLVEHTTVGNSQSTLGTPMNSSITCGKPPGDQTGPLLTPILNNNFLGGGGYHVQLGYRTTAAVVTNNDFGPIHSGEFGLIAVFETATSAVSLWSNNRTSSGSAIPNPNAPAAPVVREVLQTATDRIAAETLTTGGGTATGDTIVVVYATNNLTLSADATSNAGALVQFGTEALDGDGGAPIRCYMVPVAADGAKTVTFPAAGGFNIFGAVLVITGPVSAEGFAKLASGFAINHSSPVTTLTGSADLFIVSIMNRSGRTANFAGSGLTQRANPIATGYAQLAVGSAVLASAGSSPSYTIALDDFAKPGLVVFGLKS